MNARTLAQNRQSFSAQIPKYPNIIPAASDKFNEYDLQTRNEVKQHQIRRRRLFNLKTK